MDERRRMVLFPAFLFWEASRESLTLTQTLLQKIPKTVEGLKRLRLEGHPLHPTRTDINNKLLPVIPLNVFTSWQGTIIRLIKSS
jgi:hypothetical protein